MKKQKKVGKKKKRKLPPIAGCRAGGEASQVYSPSPSPTVITIDDIVDSDPIDDMDDDSHHTSGPEEDDEGYF